MEILDGNFRHIMLFFVRYGKSAVQSRKEFCDIYIPPVPELRFTRFLSGDLNLNDAPCSADAAICSKTSGAHE